LSHSVILYPQAGRSEFRRDEIFICSLISLRWSNLKEDIKVSDVNRAPVFLESQSLEAISAGAFICQSRLSVKLQTVLVIDLLKKLGAGIPVRTR
jgi:hypothetical protein